MTKTIDKFIKVLSILNVKSTHVDGKLTFHMKHACSEYSRFRDDQPQKVYEGQNTVLMEQWYNLLLKYCWDKVWAIFKAEHPELVSIASHRSIDKNLSFYMETKFQTLKVYTFEELTKIL
jgi:hypothetical protein